jgi:hypothetical protein
MSEGQAKLSIYIQHILKTQHIYDIICEKIEILHIEKKGHLLNILVPFHTCKLTLQKQEMKDSFKETNKRIFYSYPAYVGYPESKF